MSVAKNTSVSSIRSRRWRVPPPLTRGDELLEGSEILRELSGETGVLLWKSLRTVTLWTSASPQEQLSLFAAGARSRRLAELLAADLDPALRQPLETLTALLDEPLEARREVVALSCRQVAQWAGANGAYATELAFVQAAALVCPADADLALQVGRMTRQRGELARAESWYRRAIMLGRQTANWTAYSRSYLNLAMLAKHRGNFPVTRRLATKSLRCATRHGITEIRAMSLHQLFTVAVECEDASTAQRYAEQAYRAYGPRHPSVRYLAHDLCVLWMREGQFHRALPVLNSLEPLFGDEEALLIAANTTRAAGGMANAGLFETAWQRAAALLEHPQRSVNTSQAMLSMARGATGVKAWDRAEEMATRALTAATEGQENQNIFEAESILAFVRIRRAVESNVVRSASEPVEIQADRLAEEMICSFSAMAMA